MQRNQTIDDVSLQIFFNNLTKIFFLKFNANWINELMKRKNICFTFLKVSRRVINNNLNMKTIIYVIYCCLQNNEKTFEKLKTRIRNDILKFYKNFASSSYFSIKFNAKLLNFNRRFLTTMKTLTFFTIENVIVDRRI